MIAKRRPRCVNAQRGRFFIARNSYTTHMITFFPERRVVVDVFGIAVYWYGVLYLVAFGLGWWLLEKLQRYRDLALQADARLRILTWTAIGVVVGGRLGFAVLYEPARFLAEPLSIFRLSEGGMSAHGGFIGVAVALWLVSRRLEISPLALTDVLVVPVALGLALGRGANFINGELYVATGAWGLAVLKNVLIGVAVYAHLRWGKRWPVGETTALFLGLYAVLRWLTEYVRVQEYAWVDVFGVMVTRGQLYTIPVLGVGIWLWWRVGRGQQALGK